MAKSTDYKSWKVEELRKEVNTKREALRAFRFGGAGGRTRNVREGRNLRKEVARLLTELKQRSVAAEK